VVEDEGEHAGWQQLPHEDDEDDEQPQDADGQQVDEDDEQPHDADGQQLLEEDDGQHEDLRLPHGF